MQEKNTPVELTEYDLSDLPAGVVPTFFSVKGNCYPMKAVSDCTLECIEELVGELIQTTREPKTLLMRIAALKEHPKTKEMIWKESFIRVMARIKPRTEEEIKKEFGEKYLLIDLDSAKKDYKIPTY